MSRDPVSIRESAAAWHSRLQHEGNSPQTHKAFRAWLTESAEHRTAYQDIDSAWQALLANASRPDIRALRHETALRLTPSHSRKLPPLKWIATAAALLLMIGGFIFATHLPGGVYATGTGQQLPIVLSDGSHVTLDTESELRVAFSSHERRVRLVRGQALFDIAKDKVRPFVVAAGERRLIAVGTVFDVHLNDQQVKVTMVEGTVRVERAEPSPDYAPPAAVPSRGSPPPATLLITAGEQLISEDPRHDTVYDVNPNLVTSWLRGQVIFDDTSLAAAVTELNRYSKLQIKLADSRLADIHLSGTFAVDRPDLFVEAVTTYYPITIASRDDHIIALQAR